MFEGYTAEEVRRLSAFLHVVRDYPLDDEACMALMQRYFCQRGMRDPLPLIRRLWSEAQRRAHGLEQPQPQFDRRRRH